MRVRNLWFLSMLRNFFEISDKFEKARMKTSKVSPTAQSDQRSLAHVSFAHIAPKNYLFAGTYVS
jgi:hypothetical protein